MGKYQIYSNTGEVLIKGDLVIGKTTVLDSKDSIVKLIVDPKTITSFKRIGKDLVLVSSNDEIIKIVDYFDQDIQVVFEDASGQLQQLSIDTSATELVFDAVSDIDSVLSGNVPSSGENSWTVPLIVGVATAGVVGGAIYYFNKDDSGKVEPQNKQESKEQPGSQEQQEQQEQQVKQILAPLDKVYFGQVTEGKDGFAYYNGTVLTDQKGNKLLYSDVIQEDADSSVPGQFAVLADGTFILAPAQPIEEVNGVKIYAVKEAEIIEKDGYAVYKGKYILDPVTNKPALKSQIWIDDLEYATIENANGINELIKDIPASFTDQAPDIFVDSIELTQDGSKDGVQDDKNAETNGAIHSRSIPLSDNTSYKTQTLLTKENDRYTTQEKQEKTNDLDFFLCDSADIALNNIPMTEVKTTENQVFLDIYNPLVDNIIDKSEAIF